MENNNPESTHNGEDIKHDFKKLSSKTENFNIKSTHNGEDIKPDYKKMASKIENLNTNLAQNGDDIKPDLKKLTSRTETFNPKSTHNGDDTKSDFKKIPTKMDNFESAHNVEDIKHDFKKIPSKMETYNPKSTQNGEDLKSDFKKIPFKMENFNPEPTQNGEVLDLLIEEKITKSNGEVVIKKYSKGNLLGKGGFAKVYEFTNLETTKTCAAKIVAKSSLTKHRSKQKLISEIKIHKAIHHANIVNFIHVFEDQENVYILLEICSNQTLNELLKRRKKLKEIEVQYYVMQILEGLKYLHSSKVIHRDLKLGNLFLNEKLEIKIGDFGLAAKLDYDGEKRRTVCGTPNYIAPEVLEGKAGHSFEVDIWSLGVIIYTLLIGKPPFETSDVKNTYKKIKMNSYSFPENCNISDSARSLITKILVLDPSQRPTLDEIFAHPFINRGINIPKLLPLGTLACPPTTAWLKTLYSGALGESNTLRSSTLENNLKIGMASPKNTATNFGSMTEFGSRTDFGMKNEVNIQTTTFGMVSNSNIMKDSARINSNTSKSQKNFLASNAMSQNNNIQSMQKSKKMSPQKEDIWIRKWVDYSNKYGVGYLLSNGCHGVFFNDSTKILMDRDSTKFAYFEKKKNDLDRMDEKTIYNLSNYPDSLKKKVTLLKHFKNYMTEKNIKNDIENKQENYYNQLNKFEDNDVYLKKWMKTKHAILFRLSNKIVQVNFTDNTEIVLSSENKIVTYMNKKGVRSVYPLQTALDNTNSEMVKRLKYTRELLTYMVNGGAPENKIEVDMKI